MSPSPGLLAGGLLVAMVALGPQKGEPSAPHPVDGMRGYSTTSRVHYPQDPERAHLLQAVHVFPDRSRWQRRLEGAAPTARDVEYRFGTAVHVLRQGKKYSELLAESDARDVMLRMELRRAATAFTSGFDWQEEGRQRQAQVLERTDSRRKKAGRIGRLEATVDGDGRPTEIVAFTPEGQEARYRITVEGWLESEDRSWPRKLTMLYGERELWTEELLEATTRIDYLDAFFVPADKRDRNGRTVSRGVAIYPLDIVPFTYRLVPLEEGLDWADAIELYDGLLEEAAEGLDAALSLQEFPSFELDDRGRPVRAMLRLSRLVEPAPEGWSNTHERQGLTALHLRDVGQIDARRLKSMARLAPPDSLPGTPYVRIVEGANGQEFNLVLPLEPRAGR